MTRRVLSHVPRMLRELMTTDQACTGHHAVSSTPHMCMYHIYICVCGADRPSDTTYTYVYAPHIHMCMHHIYICICGADRPSDAAYTYVYVPHTHMCMYHIHICVCTRPHMCMYPTTYVGHHITYVVGYITYVATRIQK